MRRMRRIALGLMGMACTAFAAAFLPILTSLAGVCVWSLPERYVICCIALFFILAGASIGISLVFWRCPECGRGFPVRYGAMDRAECCPFCGSKELFVQRTGNKDSIGDGK